MICKRKKKEEKCNTSEQSDRKVARGKKETGLDLEMKTIQCQRQILALDCK